MQNVEEGVGDNLVRANYNVSTQGGNVTNAWRLPKEALVGLMGLVTD